MDHDRRNLMKGALAGGTLLALGLPEVARAALVGRISGKCRDCILLLCNTRVDTSFAQGASAAHAAYAGYTGGSAHSAGAFVTRAASMKGGLARLRTIALDEGLLPEAHRVSSLMARLPGTRWVALMDDASAAIFTELVRDADARLLLRGTHVASGDDAAPSAVGSPALRHLWVAASPRLSAADTLASELIHQHRSFSIVENFLGQSARGSSINSPVSASTPEFRSYQRAEPEARHLHCSGLSPSEGCRLVGWDEGARWAPVAARPDAGRNRAAGDSQASDWVESLGFAMTVAALGMGQQQFSAASRAFVHGGEHASQGNQGGQGGRNRRILTEERLASFIVDV